MMSFRHDEILTAPVPMAVVNLIARINEFKGRQQLYQQQSPQVLDALQQAATIESTESSNRIEGIVLPEKNLRQIVANAAKPANRSEGEVAGYRDVLATIHASHPHIPVTPNTLLQLHRDLYKYVPSEGGKWKPSDNTIDEVLADGTHVVRFTPVSAFDTPRAVAELCEGYNKYSADQTVSPLLFTGAFVLDLLCIHPFLDGNGRIARLATILLLYQMGYDVGRYISLERIIEQTKESYYDSLAASSEGWHEGKHSLLPWWEYFLGVTLAAYREFESRAGMVDAGRGAKSALVRRMVDGFVGDFTLSELSRICPHVSRDTIRNVLERLRTEGIVECLGTGRSARWRKTGGSS